MTRAMLLASAPTASLLQPAPLPLFRDIAQSADVALLGRLGTDRASGSR